MNPEYPDVFAARNQPNGALMNFDEDPGSNRTRRCLMKVLLLYPTWTGAYGLFGHFARRNSTWPPLNLALLAAIAEQHGHDVTILDGEAEQIPLDDMVETAVAQKPDLIGFTATSPFFHLSEQSQKASSGSRLTFPSRWEGLTSRL